MMKRVNLMPAAILVGATLLVLVPLSSGLRLPRPRSSAAIAPAALVTCREEIVAYKAGTIVPVLDVLVEALAHSHTISRLQVATAVDAVQAVQQQVSAMEPDACATSTHLLFVETTQSILNGYLSSAANDLTESAVHFDRASELLKLLQAPPVTAGSE